MSRYSPTVRPEPGTPLTSALAEAFDAYTTTRRQRTQEARQRTEDQERGQDRTQAREGADLAYYERGGRRGAMPDDTGVNLDLHDVAREFRLPAPGGLAGVGPGNALEPDRPAPVGPEVDDRALSQQLRAGAGPTPTTIDQFQPRPPGPGVPAAVKHPGAFDPTTGTFGGSAMARALGRTAPDVTAPGPAAPPRHVALGSPGRYTPIDATHYIDETQTPRAEAQRDRESNAALAAQFRQGDIAARGTEARQTEELRQKGREGLRRMIDGDQINAILLRGALTGENQKEHDARVGDQKKIKNPATAAHDQTNALKAAEGVIGAAAGDEDAANDWLTNTPEGQDAFANGLRPYHLHIAAGSWRTGMTRSAMGLQHGFGGQTPSEAGATVRKTATNVAPQPKPKAPASSSASAPPSPAAGAPPTGGDPVSDAAKWKAANPRQKGESDSTYYQRYLGGRKQ